MEQRGCIEIRRPHQKEAMRFFVSLISVGFSALLILADSQAHGGNWKLYFASDEIFYFYDVRSVAKSNGIIQVSEKYVFRKKKPCNLKEALQEAAESDNRSSEIKDESRKKTVAALALQEVSRLYEIHCSRRKYRVVAGMEYDAEETVIDAILSTAWERIKPDSAVEKLFRALCY